MRNNYKDIIEEILSKKFSKSFNSGYSSLEVDMFFDKVKDFVCKLCIDKVNMEKEITEKDAKINSLMDQLEKKEQNNRILEMEIESLKKDGYSHVKLTYDVSDLKQAMHSLMVEKNNGKK